jgi:putative transposase
LNSTGLKKKLDCSVEQKRALIATSADISLQRQCELLGLARASYYYEPMPVSATNLRLMNLLDEQYLETPFYGARKMTAWLIEVKKENVNVKRIRRLMRLMGLETIYQKPRLSLAAAGQQVYPYLLRGVPITQNDQVWSTDITYIRLHGGFVYLVAIIDWYSRYVISWEVSTALETDFCVSTLERALARGKPQIFNTDQGAQFTSYAFTGILKEHGIAISMDGRGRALDNIFVERLWRSVKYEEVYLHDYADVPQAIKGLSRYFKFYNHERIHQSLDYKTPAAVYQTKA